MQSFTTDVQAKLYTAFALADYVPGRNERNSWPVVD